MSAQASTNSYVVVKASIFPLLTCVVFLVASAVLYALRFAIASDAVYYIGYVLTPVGTIAAMGWDFRAQRVGQQKHQSFDIRPVYTKVIRILVIAGFLIGALHMIEIGKQIGQLVVQGAA